MPSVVIERIVLIIFGYSDGVQMTRNRLFPGNFAIQIGLLYPTLQDPSIVV